MSSPLGIAARVLGRLLNPAPALFIAASVSLAPTIVAEATARDEWEFGGFHNFSHHMSMNDTQLAISNRDLRLFAEVLELDEIQQEIMGDVYAEFVKTYNREWTLNAERQSDARVRREADRVVGWHMSGFPELEAEFDAAKERLETEFFSDVRLLLTSEQSERWPLLEREHRRLKTLSAYASFADERIDLVVSVRSIDLDEASIESLRPLLDEYRLQIDAALVPRNNKARSLGEGLQALQSKEDDARNMQNPMEMHEVWAKIREEQQELVPLALELHGLCSRLRDINRHYQARIEERLPPDAADAFRDRTTTSERNPLDGMFRASRMLTMLEMMAENTGSFRNHMMSGMNLEVPALTDEQMREIELVREDFEARRSTLFARYLPNGWTEAESASISLSTPHGQLSLTRRVQSSSQDNISRYINGVPISDELQSGMNELDQDIVDRLRQILTIEQRQMLVRH